MMFGGYDPDRVQRVTSKLQRRQRQGPRPGAQVRTRNYLTGVDGVTPITRSAPNYQPGTARMPDWRGSGRVSDIQDRRGV